MKFLVIIRGYCTKFRSLCNSLSFIVCISFTLRKTDGIKGLNASDFKLRLPFQEDRHKV